MKMSEMFVSLRGFLLFEAKILNMVSWPLKSERTWTISFDELMRSLQSREEGLTRSTFERSY